ncbi:MAG: alpha-hydroxy acid oxidase [Chloroflexota bacterium]
MTARPEGAPPAELKREVRADPRSELAAALSVADLERLALRRMPPEAGDFVTGGSEDERTLADNAAAFARRRFVPRVLVDVERIDTRTTLLGREVALPIGVAPTAAHGLVHPDAEAATARAAGRAGAMFCLSTVSSLPLDVVATPDDGPRWFQLYVNEDRAFTRRLLERAEQAGYEAIVLTVDLPVLGYREREKRRGWSLDVPLGNFGRPEGSRSAVADDAQPEPEIDLDELLDSRHGGLTWDDLDSIREWTPLPLVVKGILHPDDARLAVEHGAKGVWVSNHGGRQLDRSVASLDALEGVVAAVGGRAEVYVDGGVRRGSDALVALALGARAVFAGRAFLYGLGAGGEAGVDRAFAILRDELERAMALLGTPSLDQVRREHLIGQ